MSAREVIARRRCQGEPNATYPCRRLCGACLSWADADLAALREAGHVVVPVEPTEAMLKSGYVAFELEAQGPVGIYDAMLAAASEDQR